MKLHIDRDGSHLHLTLRGDLDAHVRDAFLEKALQLVDEGAERLTLDMTRVRYITSSGVGALIRLRKALQRLGGSLLLTRASHEVLHTLELLGLSELFLPAGAARGARAAG